MKMIIRDMVHSLKCIEKYLELLLTHMQYLTTAYTAQLEKNSLDPETGLYEYLDRQGVMDYLGISARSYYRFLAQGVLKAHRMGGRDYFLKKDLNEILLKGPRRLEDRKREQ